MEKSAVSLTIFMGVSGCGKTTVAKEYARVCKIQFYDADDFHSNQAKSHMAKGLPLTDNMREPWIKKMVDEISLALKDGQSCTLAYSGLKSSQRMAFLSIDASVTFIHLTLPIAETQKRVRSRNQHFFPAHLVQSQYDSLESEANGETLIEIDATQTVDEIVHQLL